MRSLLIACAYHATALDLLSNIPKESMLSPICRIMNHSMCISPALITIARHVANGVSGSVAYLTFNRRHMNGNWAISYAGGENGIRGY
jgi:hypothetical protein